MADEKKSAEEPPKKRVALPVIGQKSRPLDTVDLGNDLPAQRSPAAWVILGALATFVVLVPLGLLAPLLFGNDLRRSVGGLIAYSIAAVAVSSFAGGYLVGRFGGSASPKTGAYAGVLAGVVMWGLSRASLGVVIFALTVPAALAGAHVGRRSRQPGDTIGS